MLEGKRIAVVVPAYNEADRIAAVVSSLPSFVDVVVVVDDASTDETSRIARATRSDAVVVAHRENRGVGAAIATGYREAIARDADIAVVMAGDGQMSPLDLARVALPIAKGRADYAKGDRLSHRDVAGSMPLPRLVLGRALSSLTRSATGLVGLSDSQCGFTAISRAAIETVDLAMLYPRYGYPNDLIGLVAARGLRIVDVVVAPIYRGEKSGLRPWHLFVIGTLVARVYVRRRAREAGFGASPSPSIATRDTAPRAAATSLEEPLMPASDRDVVPMRPRRLAPAAPAIG